MADISQPVLVTGATGFVGRALVAALERRQDIVRLAVRRASGRTGEIVLGNLHPDTDWSASLSGVGIVVHLAARVHVMRETAGEPLRAFRELNVHVTERLARQAAAAGVGRFVYLSSIKVNGERTPPDRPFTETDTPAPEDAYGMSKLEAEQRLATIGRETGLEVVIIRPPLVYGPGVKANFLSMMRWLRRGIPLPFGSIDNRRTLVGLDNLTDLILACMHHPAAANRTFLAGDAEDLSTTDLLRRLGLALGRPARLYPVPATALIGAFTVLGKSDLARRLCGSLSIDTAAAREALGWTPPVTVDEGLRKTAADFLRSNPATS